MKTKSKIFTPIIIAIICFFSISPIMCGPIELNKTAIYRKLSNNENLKQELIKSLNNLERELQESKKENVGETQKSVENLSSLKNILILAESIDKANPQVRFSFKEKIEAAIKQQNAIDEIKEFKEFLNNRDEWDMIKRRVDHEDFLNKQHSQKKK